MKCDSKLARISGVLKLVLHEDDTKRLLELLKDNEEYSDIRDRIKLQSDCIFCQDSGVCPYTEGFQPEIDIYRERCIDNACILYEDEDDTYYSSEDDEYTEEDEDSNDVEEYMFDESELEEDFEEEFDEDEEDIIDSEEEQEEDYEEEFNEDEEITYSSMLLLDAIGGIYEEDEESEYEEEDEEDEEDSEEPYGDCYEEPGDDYIEYEVFPEEE